jgi:hypothetical protein
MKRFCAHEIRERNHGALAARAAPMYIAIS